MIVGFVAADGGRIALDGRDLSRLPIHVRARLGCICRSVDFRKLTVAENVRAILELQDLDADALSNRLDALLRISRFRISPMRRRCRFQAENGGASRSRGAATRPRFILLDEPFAGRPDRGPRYSEDYRFLRDRGIGVLITDHNVRETLGICDRAYIINEGRVLASGAPDEIVYNEAVRKVYLGEHFRL
jgi:lipopolysaccharide export system ATP-binding protein